MRSRRGLSGRSHLYAILDRDFLDGRGIVKAAGSVASAGAGFIQLRDKRSSTPEMIKTAKAVKRIAGRHRIPFIVNDRLDVAAAVDADGLHIGQGDFSVRIARSVMGRDKLIGVSVSTTKEAIAARAEGADYLGAGPIFATPVKRGRRAKGLALLEMMRRLRIPFFAIGGINRDNVRRLAARGFRNVAVIRAVCRAKDPARAAKRLKEALR